MLINKIAGKVHHLVTAVITPLPLCPRARWHGFEETSRTKRVQPTAISLILRRKA